MALFDQELIAIADTTVNVTGGEVGQGTAKRLLLDAEHVILLRFNLQDLLLAYELERVELLLFHRDASDDLALAAFAASGRWDEATNDATGIDLGGAPLAEAANLTANHYIMLDLTSAVRTMASYNIESLNLFLRGTDNEQHRLVAREHDNADLRPRLRVVYAAPATAIPVAATTPTVRPLSTILPVHLPTPLPPAAVGTALLSPTAPPTLAPTSTLTPTPAPTPTATVAPPPTLPPVPIQGFLPTLTPTPTSPPIAIALLLPTVTPAPTVALEKSDAVTETLSSDGGAQVESPLAVPPLPASDAIQVESPLPLPEPALDLIAPELTVTSTPLLPLDSLTPTATLTLTPGLGEVLNVVTATITPVVMTTITPVVTATVEITTLLELTPTLAVPALPPDMLAQAPLLAALAPQSGYPAHNNGMPYSPTSEACAGCHRAHDGNDQSLASQGAEEEMCYTCHAGAGAATRVQSDFQAPYRHPVEATLGLHDAGESIPESFSGASRHVECADCHEPHGLAAGSHTAGSTYRAPSLQGVWGVSVNNGPGGSTPTFARVDAVTHEYELCFKCHSGWSSTGSGTDVAAEANPYNAGHHAIEAPGRNQPGAINPNFDATFVAPWNSQSTPACSDCHRGSNAAGPHGSSRPYILRANETGIGSPAVYCYNCHRREVYGDVDLQNPPYASLSRFMHPTERDHTQLTGKWGSNLSGIWCKNCHAGDTTGAIHGTNRGVGAYGSTPLGARLMNGQFVDGWTAASGRSQGACWASCHPGAESYRANYDYAP